MRIEEDVKLDFTDVLIRPKRSTLVSRKNAELDRIFTFKYSKHHWKGVPIVASNMDHTGTIKMSEVLGEHNMLTALCKFEKFPENDNSLRARDLTHPTVGQQNFLYEQFLKVWENING